MSTSFRQLLVRGGSLDAGTILLLRTMVLGAALGLITGVVLVVLWHIPVW